MLSKPAFRTNTRVAVQTLYLGISAVFADDHTVAVAMAVHDTVYLVDFSVKHVALDDDTTTPGGSDPIADHVLATARSYEHDNIVKFIGAGVPPVLRFMSPTLCSRLWLELDVVPIVMRPDGDAAKASSSFWDVKSVDEQADSMARKCIRYHSLPAPPSYPPVACDCCVSWEVDVGDFRNFGPSLVPLLQVGFRGIVQTDAGFRVHLNTLQNHRDTCGELTWEATMHYAKKLQNGKVKIAFFSSTPQGGGVALMRHALVRLSRLMGVDLTWYGAW